MSDLIIVEGPDCTGKTSLAKFIARTLQACYIHSSGKVPLHLAMWDYHQSILDGVEFTLEHCHTSVVLDRHWPSEWTYGKLLRPVTHQLSQYDFGQMFERIQQSDPLYIFCHGTPASRERMIGHADDHSYPTSDYDMVAGEYRILMTELQGRARVKSYSIEINGHDIEQFMTDCKIVW